LLTQRTPLPQADRKRNSSSGNSVFRMSASILYSGVWALPNVFRCGGTAKPMMKRVTLCAPTFVNRLSASGSTFAPKRARCWVTPMMPAEVLERSVKAISRYLDKSAAPLHSADPGGLLVLSCYRSFRRLARRRNHIVPIGGGEEISEILRAPARSSRPAAFSAKACAASRAKKSRHTAAENLRL
jgi:hypothetical protein